MAFIFPLTESFNRLKYFLQEEDELQLMDIPKKFSVDVPKEAPEVKVKGKNKQDPFYGRKSPGRKNGEKFQLDAEKDIKKRYRVKPEMLSIQQASDLVVKKMVKEMLEALTSEDPYFRNAIGWYGEKYQQALDDLKKYWKGLKNIEALSNREDELLFTLITAITSNGTKVIDNFKNAILIFENFLSTGNIALATGSDRGVIGDSLDLLDKMVKAIGKDKIGRLMLVERPLSVSKGSGRRGLKTLANIVNKKFSLGLDPKKLTADYPDKMRLPLAVVFFGEKIGAFYANLSGKHIYLTMDRWFSRTINRYRGKMIPKVQGLDKPKWNTTQTRSIPVGITAYKVMRGIRNASEDETIRHIITDAESFKSMGYKSTAPGFKPYMRVANTIYKKLFLELNDTPFDKNDRAFMIQCVKRTQNILKAKGYNLTIDDIQAVLWYWEKAVYADAKGSKRPVKPDFKTAMSQVLSGATNDDEGEY